MHVRTRDLGKGEGETRANELIGLGKVCIV